jgi:hypothetical protein
MTVSDDELRAAFADIAVPETTLPSADEIQALVDRTGDEATRLDVLARLVATPEGRRELAMIRALHTGFMLEAEPDQSSPDGAAGRHTSAVEVVLPMRPARDWSFSLRPMALAALLLLSVFGIRQLVLRTSDPVYRSSPPALTLLAPTDGATVRAPLTLMWRSARGSSYEVELYTTDGRELLRTSVPDTVLRVPPAVPPGDYRWWVTARLDDGTQIRSATWRVVLR